MKLTPMPRQDQTALSAFLDRRLPRIELLTIPEVATACRVSSSVVRGWIEEGSVEAANMGAGRRARWLIYRPSVLLHMERRQQS